MDSGEVLYVGDGEYDDMDGEDNKNEEDDEDDVEEEEEEEEEDSEDEYLKNVDEDFNFEDNRKVIEGLKGELKDIKKTLTVEKKKLSHYDKRITEINQDIIRKDEEIKYLQEKEKEATKMTKKCCEEYYDVADKYFVYASTIEGKKKLYDEAKAKEKNVQKEISEHRKKKDALEQELADIKRNKHSCETLIQKKKYEKGKKKKQIDDKKEQKRQAKKQESSLMDTPFQPFSGDSQSLDAKVKRHYFQKIHCLEALPEECRFLNILLVGPSGAGKSSFVNTSATALEDKGRMIHVSTTRRIESESATMKLMPEVLKIDKDSNLTVRIFDCRGLTMTGNKPIGKTEIELVIGGHIKPFSEISAAVSMVKDENIYVKEPQLKNEMHCVVYAVKASGEGEFLNDDIGKEIKGLLDILTPTSKPQFILLTNMDKVVPKGDVANLFRYKCVRRRCNEASDETHVTPGYILPTANYTTEREPTDVKDALCLFNLYRIVSNAHDYINRRIIEDKIKKEK